ncbi:hypothetical protein LUZ60_003760 [Juncus effusus]|nr:hypothetical protein LUZ60_003760 [Juncus effusus]
MSVGVRQLTVLREFRPFGLTAEEADGDAAVVPEKYQYCLFGSEVTRESSPESGLDESAAGLSEFGEHELFVRGNRIIWSMGTRVYKRYTAESAVIMVCWCRMESIPEPVLCALQTDNVTLYTSQGDVFCMPLPYYITSISPLTSGLLLQKAADVSRPISSSSPPLHRKEPSRSSRDKDHGLNVFKPPVRDDPALVSSHLVLSHPLKEPQATYFEERGKLSLMKDFEEKTIWTSDQIPLMASYNKSKFQHSIWNIDIAGPDLSVQSEISSHHFTFQRIWQGKCSQSPSTKVFLSADIDATPVLCLLFSDQKLLLGIRLQIDYSNDDGFTDIKPQSSWSFPAIDASPVIVTRPSDRAGLLPFTDIVVLGPENNLFLYSGKQCLCRYTLPTPGLGEPKITAVKDSVEGRINVICNNNKVYRCILRKYPCSSLVKDCITAMSEGLNSSFYAHFLSLLWGDEKSSYLSHSDSHPDQEWESFIIEISKICNKIGNSVLKRENNLTVNKNENKTAWDFLLDSGFHARYQKQFCGSFLSILSDNNSVLSESKYNYAYETKESGKDEVNYYIGLIKETLDSLHALYESLKLNILRKQDVELLASLLLNISSSLNETNYTDYYIRDFPCLSLHSQPSRQNYDSTPPCLFLWLETCLRTRGKMVKNSSDIPPLISKAKSSVLGWARKVVLFYTLLLGAESEEVKEMRGSLGTGRNREEITILAMVGERFGRQHLDLLPVGVSLPLRHVLDKCRESPPPDWPVSAYMLIGREDLATTKLRNPHGSQSGGGDLASLSVPYMLHLQPVTMPDSAGLEASSSEDLEGNGNVEDGMEHVFGCSMKLRYGRDLRLNEARRLLCCSKPVVIPMSVNPSATDQEVQQHKLWNLAQRTAALPFGRGAFTLSTTYTLLTEALVIPKLVLAGRLPAQQNATVNLDPNIRNVTELTSWPNFHNGVAAGLRLAPFQGKMARTWILYNKPEEPSYAHAGLLLALGFHGHLQVLCKTDVFGYLTQEHDVTSASLLLGLAASNRGSMDVEVSKTLNCHVPGGPGGPNCLEFELPTLVQSSALMAIGLLYEGSAHPLNMKMLLGEIGRKSGSDNVLEWEGYAVAAGSALGLVALGRGGDALGFADSFVDRLFDYIGTKGFYTLSDGKQVNFYVTAPGATIALALIFLKTEAEEIANRLQIPQTRFDLQYVRPDFIMLRIIARNLIMWTRMRPTRDWIESQVPEFIRIEIGRTGEDSVTGDNHSEALFQAYVNIITGTCISLGLKYAGTRNGDVQELLYNYATYFLNEMKHVGAPSSLELPKGLLQNVDRATLELSVHLIVLSLSVVMAGSGNLQTLRLLRYLRSRSSAEGHINYGLQMAVSLGIGFLFLGGGMQTFSTRKSSIAALLITLYPRLPAGPNDNRCHLQAFRHLYVMAAEPRWIQTVDVDTGLPVYCPIEITVKETDFYGETTFCEVTPCLLPERSVLKSIRVCGPRYWPQFIELEPEDEAWWRAGDKRDPFNGGMLYIKRKVGSCSYSDDPVGCQSLLSRAMHKVSGASSITVGTRNLGENSSFKIDQLVSTFSADPSLIAFAKLCCDSSPDQSSDANFQEFCSQVLYECVSKDRPALLQVYLCLYTMIEAIGSQVRNGFPFIQDSIFISSLKVALAYSDALISGRINHTNGGGIIQPTFIESLRKRVEEYLSLSQVTTKDNFINYLNKQEWPSEIKKSDKILLSWYLLWYNIPSPRVVGYALEKIRNNSLKGFSMVPVLKLLLPGANFEGIVEIEKFRVSLGR